ncbi:peptide deformylase [Mycoplasma feriruminatoris]|uniref:Peptide deformylase n=1 Tax=Mycoplasma feriruminatoris TaxID=1179777 RepID=A0ABY8HVS6_9MOLU|nr:peptide deformylase [Mycoplasma feriruminatoris]WFQ93727.1 peptide deformylase [Mycoplasma feriruminatoris]
MDKSYLLQDQIPSNSWLVKDHKKEIIRTKSIKLDNPENLSNEDELIMKKLIDFVTFSQDENNNNVNNKDYLRPAVGLAAPQIGVNKDMFYVRFQLENHQIEQYAMINTKLVSYSTQIACLKNGEGCLSVDNDHLGLVPRCYKIVVSGYDWLTKKYITLTLRNYQAIVFQHEMDHNIGVLYYDHINKQDPLFKKDDWILIE